MAILLSALGAGAGVVLVISIVEFIRAWTAIPKDDDAVLLWTLAGCGSLLWLALHLLIGVVRKERRGRK